MFTFILTAVGISLSGVLAPGPMTTGAFALGARNRHAGLAMGLGHVCVELPLMLLLVPGTGAFFTIQGVQAAIGFAGGAFLLFMGAQLLASLRKAGDAASTASVRRGAFVTGVVMTFANPYFLLWWATVGLTLATQALSFGVAALIIFAILHWGCDIAWLEILSTASHKGTQAIGQRSQTIINAVCGVALIFFGMKFIYGAGICLLI